MRPRRVATAAKVNLFLRVMGIRPDGYHEVETVLHTVSLYDEITLRPTSSGHLELTMTGAEPDYPFDMPRVEENLVTEVVLALEARGAVNPGLQVKVTKRIPIGAGLGGGSGNAAGVLVALADMWGLELERHELLEIAAKIGADVPYCVVGGTALATARGDDLTPLPAPEPMWFVLGITHDPLPTRAVYATYDELAPEDRPEPHSAPLALALGAGDVAEVAALLHNDLERAAFALRPGLEDKKRALLEAGALGAVLSGSGPTLFGVCESERHARMVAADVAGAFDRVEVVTSAPQCVRWLD